jgi:flagellin
MSISIQTNVASLNAQYYIGINQHFQNTAIQQLSSGYKINSSADDPAGLAVANQYAGEVTQLTQGVQNATNGVSTLQIADGGLSNISQILGRLQTLAAESASQTFQGNRATVNSEYQGLLTEINRQAANIGLNSGGVNNTNLTVYTGGGSSQANSEVTVNLAGTNNAVDATSLGIGSTSVAGGGAQISGNTVDLSNTAVSFLTSTTQNFTFNLNTGTGNQAVTIALNPTSAAAGLSGTAVVSSLNTSLAAYGITASIGSNGSLEFGGSTAFTVNTTTAGASTVSTTGSASNTSNFNIDSGAYTAITGASETDLFQNASGTVAVAFSSAVGNSDTLANAIATANTQLSGTGITAVQNAGGNGISFQSTSAFSVSQTAAAGGGQIFAPGVQTVNKPTVGSTDTGNALAALSALTQAIANLGLVQGSVGAGENKLQYATNLAQSQITNVSAAESGIRDADVAAAAANLTKAQVLQQTSLAALSQANSAPQAVLALLKNF